MDTHRISNQVSEKDTENDLVRDDSVHHHLPRGAKLATIFVGLVLSVFLVALDLTIIATAIPRITDDFGSVSQIGWYGSAFFLTNAAFQSTWGKAYTYFAQKQIFLISIAIFEVGSLICGVAPNSSVLITGRAISGLGGAGITTGSFTIIATIASPKNRPVYIGVLGSTYGLASIVGPLLGGVFTEFTTWRWCFWVNLPLGAMATIIMSLCFQTPKSSRPMKATMPEKWLQMDPLGAAVVIGGVVCYLLAMCWGGINFAWASPQVLATLFLFGTTVILFLALEWMIGSRAMLQLRLLKDGVVISNLAYIFFLAGIYFPLLYFLPLQFQAISGDTAAQSGVRLIPLVLSISICTVCSNVTGAKLGYRLPFLVLGPPIAAVGVGLLYTMDLNGSNAQWAGYQILTGVGIGIALQVPMVINQERVSPSDIPAMIATTLFFEIMGACIFVSACEAALSNRLKWSLQRGEFGVTVSEVLSAGATRLVEVFAPSKVHLIRGAYFDALKGPHLIAI
ncbi:MAG: hypothetical protein Q9161_009796, partial [Pseudevernia consocians]